MSAALDTVLPVHGLLVALLVFGFAPGAALRVIALAFHKDDPRRHEMLAELYAVPRLERPFWVVEQLEVALFEGLWQRLVWAATGRIIWRWRLDSGVERNRQYPDSFLIPDADEKRALEPGAVVKLMFHMKDGWGERMWVQIDERTKRGYSGILTNQPAGIPRLSAGDRIRFRDEHIIGIWYEDEDLYPECA